MDVTCANKGRVGWEKANWKGSSVVMAGGVGRELTSGSDPVAIILALLQAGLARQAGAVALLTRALIMRAVIARADSSLDQECPDGVGLQGEVERSR